MFLLDGKVNLTLVRSGRTLSSSVENAKMVFNFQTNWLSS
jgi:hypothetical protein